MRKMQFMALLAVVVMVASCSDSRLNRQEVREKLDAEFEQQTEEIMEQALELKARVKSLLEKHEKMDLLHSALDEKLEGDNPDPVVVALQKKHEKWGEDHKQVLLEVKELVEKFEERHEQHEKMEESHGDVPIKQIIEEHEQFEADLNAFKEQFVSALLAVNKANEQMDIIFDEHKELEEMQSDEQQ